MIYIGADHRGFELKEELKRRLEADGFEIEDMGNEVFDPADDYVDFAKAVAQSVVEDSDGKGVLICGSGVGVDMAANKVRGARSCLVFDEKRAMQSREHEDANIICLASDVLIADTAYEMVKTFIATPFTGEERHVRRINKLKELEQYKIR
jgi:ribose 5-phosphate isomerase B